MDLKATRTRLLKDKERIDKQLEAIDLVLSLSEPQNGPRMRKPMSAAARAALSKRMKAAWKKRKKKA